ncbi:dihydroorotase family protein [Candidatus Bathyarchaeota archaeon]|nr:dihydroorotase family protein [Candidatus Bathyarchaeota archaeon]
MKLRSLRLKNCKVFHRGSIVDDAEIFLENGRITDITKLGIQRPVDETFDLKGLLVIPGLIDVHVHLRGLNLAYKEDYDTGTMAAASGGVTTVLDMPNTNPPTVDSKSLKLRVEAAEPKLYVNTGFYSFVPEDLTEASKLADAGIFGFKLFMHRRMPGYKFETLDGLRDILKAVSKVDLPLLVHAEDREVLETVKSENPNGDLETFEKALSEESEEKAVKMVLKALKAVKEARVHFCHVSSIGALKAIEMAKASGLPISCEVTPHHLLLTREVCIRLGFYGLVDPPLRSKESSAGLWSGIKRGVVDCIATDHAPHTLEEKTVGTLWSLKTGFPGLETLLPLMLDCVNKGRLSLSELVRLTAHNPAKIFRIVDRGRIEVGYWADLTVVDLKKEAVIEPSSFKSKAKHSPFEGWRVRGVPQTVFVNGEPVVLEGELVCKPGVGRVLKPGVS